MCLNDQNMPDPEDIKGGAFSREINMLSDDSAKIKSLSSFLSNPEGRLIFTPLMNPAANFVLAKLSNTYG